MRRMALLVLAVVILAGCGLAPACDLVRWRNMFYEFLDLVDDAAHTPYGQYSRILSEMNALSREFVIAPRPADACDMYDYAGEYVLTIRRFLYDLADDAIHQTGRGFDYHARNVELECHGMARRIQVTYIEAGGDWSEIVAYARKNSLTAWVIGAAAVRRDPLGAPSPAQIDALRDRLRVAGWAEAKIEMLISFIVGTP